MIEIHNVINDSNTSNESAKDLVKSPVKSKHQLDKINKYHQILQSGGHMSC